MIFLTGIILSLLSTTKSLNVETFSEVKSVAYKGTSKEATCDITVEYSGSDIIQSGSTVSCVISWPKAKDLDKDVVIQVTVGDVLKGIISVEVSFNLYKKKNQVSSKTKTRSVSFNSDLSGEPASYPADLWCPEEDTIIYGDNGASGVANETMEVDWQDCAYQCATYINAAGNAPCFSWTFNNGASEVFGLGPGVCRLLNHMNVKRMTVQGVQSGYHKCWKAYSTSEHP